MDVSAGADQPDDSPAREIHAIALAATLPEVGPSPLTAAEASLLAEWLDRLARRS